MAGTIEIMQGSCQAQFWGLILYFRYSMLTWGYIYFILLNVDNYFNNVCL